MPLVDRSPGVRPRVSLGHRLDAFARVSFPATITVAMMLLIEAPLLISGQSAMLPATAIVGVWFWSLTQPRYLPPPVVFLIGILLDLLGYLPPGVGVLTLLCVHGVAVAVRRFVGERGFLWIWFVFALVASGASLLIWLLVMLLTPRLFSPAPAIFEAAVSIAIYPLLAVPLAAARRRFVNPGAA
jgi:rod shape-determining protein MreD